MDYIRNYSSQGYSIDYIKQFLLKNNIPEHEIDEAINFLGRESSINRQNLSLESQLSAYINSQLRAGYDSNSLRQMLISKGYDPAIVARAFEPSNGLDIHVKHEVHFSEKTILGISAAVIVVAVALYAIFGLGVFASTSLLDVSISSNLYSYTPGSTINYQLQVVNMGKSRVDSTITYIITDDSGTVYTRRSETLAVETTTSVSRSLAIPQNMAPGTYYLKVIADYSGKEASSSIEFNIAANKQAANLENSNNTGGAIPISTTQNNNTSTGNGTSSSLPQSQESQGTQLGTTNTQQGTVTVGKQMSTITNLAQTNPSAAINQCKDFNTQDYIDICESNVAGTSNRSSYCSYISGMNTRDNCYLAFVISGDTSLCNKIIDNQSREFCNQLNIVSEMNKYYQENNTDKVFELSKQFNPSLYSSTPVVATYDYIYNDTVPITTIMINLNETNMTSTATSENMTSNATNNSTNSTT